MERQLYIVTILARNGGDLVERRVTDGEHLERAVDRARRERGARCTYHVSLATMCLDGYLVADTYLGDWTDRKPAL